MNDFTIELPNEAEPTKIIRIEVAKHTDRYFSRVIKKCPHSKVQVDITLSNLKCLDCGESLNPIVWINDLANEWHRVDRMYKQYKEAEEKHVERTRTKCIYCQKFTPIRPK